MDYKFIAIPVAFVLLRIGSLVHNILGVYAAHQKWERPELHLIFKYIDVSCCIIDNLKKIQYSSIFLALRKKKNNNQIMSVDLFSY